MSRILRRPTALQAILLERVTGVDGQGKPAYSSAITIQGAVQRNDKPPSSAQGSLTRPPQTDESARSATVWVAVEEGQPSVGDRVTFEDGAIGIVNSRAEVRRVFRGLDHTRLGVLVHSI